MIRGLSCLAVREQPRAGLVIFIWWSNRYAWKTFFLFTLKRMNEHTADTCDYLTVTFSVFYTLLRANCLFTLSAPKQASFAATLFPYL